MRCWQYAARVGAAGPHLLSGSCTWCARLHHGLLRCALLRRLSIKRDRQHVLFGGTKLLQTMGDKGARIKTPDNGCLAVVLRTGFGTAQGKWVGGWVGGAVLAGLEGSGPLGAVAAEHAGWCASGGYGELFELPRVAGAWVGMCQGGCWLAG